MLPANPNPTPERRQQRFGPQKPNSGIGLLWMVGLTATLVLIGYLFKSIHDFLGFPPLDVGVAMLYGGVIIGLILIAFAAKFAPHEVMGIVGCIGLLATLGLTVVGFPWLSPGWRMAWWKRLLDVAAILVWVTSLLVAYIYSTGQAISFRNDWWRMWLIVLVPFFISLTIRRTLMFIVGNNPPHSKPSA